MSKEAVSLNLDDVTSVRPFRDYYEQRNGTVAQYLAKYLDLPYRNSAESAFTTDMVYSVPAKTLLKSRARTIGIQAEEDFYGAAVDYIEHVGKSILHPTVSELFPNFYSPAFAQAVRHLVLPGLTAFSCEEAMESFLRLKKAFPLDYLRCKAANQSDGHGQYSVSTEQEARTLLATLEKDIVQNQGIVLELGVQHPRTISVGYAIIGNDRFSFIADQKNDKGEDGRDRYAGCIVQVAQGDLYDLYHKVALDVAHREALEVGAEFYHTYSHFDPIASRLSFDYVYGETKQGEHVGGITDITARLGGTCPALVMAADELKCNRDIGVIQGEVTLNYEPDIFLPEEENAINFIDEPTLRLSARLHQTT